MHKEGKLDAQNERRLQSAIQAQQNDQPEQALTQYQIILKTYPKHSMVLHLVGITFAQLNQLKQAITYFERAISCQPNHPIYIASLANAYRRNHKIEKAVELFNKALAINPSLVSAHNNLALIYFNKAPEQARYHFEQAIMIKPDHLDANYNLGLLLTKLNKHKAEECFQKVIKLNSEHVGALFQLAQLHHANKAYLKAQPLYQKILNLQPNDPECLNKLGLILLEQDHFDQGLDYLEQALKIDQNIEDIHHNLACCYLHKKNYQDALAHWLKHLKVSQDLDTYYNIGVCYLYLGRYDDCTDQLFHVIKKDPKHYQSLINLGAAFLQKGQATVACEYYKRAQALKPTESIAYILSALEQSQSPQTAPEDYISGLFDNYAYHYDNHLCDVLSYKLPDRLKSLMIEQLNFDKNSQQILDLGCGTGLAGKAVSEFSQALVGIDLSKNMLNEAKKKNIYQKLIAANVLTLQHHLAHKQDVVICADTLPYFGNLNDVFSIVQQYLKKQGHWIISIESDYANDYKLTETARYTHSPKYIESCANKYSFSIAHSENIHLRTQQKTLIEGMIFILQYHA
tara:strand:+ start:1356 stop:3068 length:1713 start_codon:yes stop_codon:yes gene_type:complete